MFDNQNIKHQQNNPGNGFLFMYDFETSTKPNHFQYLADSTKS